MSQENVELHKRGIDALNRHDLDAFLELMDPDVTASPLIATVEGNTYRGSSGIREWWRDLHSTFSDFRVELSEIRSEGDMTVASLHNRGRGSGSDTPFDQPTWHVVEWRNGKCLSWWNFRNEAEALEAAGLRE
jgi:ketosteroid isomerase-like protein